MTSHAITAILYGRTDTFTISDLEVGSDGDGHHSLVSRKRR